MMRHGTITGYIYHRCRCDDCREANSTYRRNGRRNTPPQDHLASQTWREAAACHGIDTAVFYPTVKGGRGSSPARRAYDRAIAICHTCPVNYQCLWYALDHKEEHGVWGATTPDDRKALARLGKRAAV